MAASETQAPADLPSDNGARIAIYDALADAPSTGAEPDGVSVDALFAAVIRRLRVLVPRELHLAGEHRYLQEKIDACVGSGLLERIGPGQESVRLTGTPPKVRYPDGMLRDYHQGLEPARERLDADNARLREARFDIRRHVPSLAEDTDSPEFQALVASMREHGFLKQFKVAEFSDGIVVDGRARVAAAELTGEVVEQLTLRTKQEQSAARRRDTPLQRVLLALDANGGRLSDRDRQHVHDAVSKATRRSWPEIAADLGITREWRRAAPREYYPRFEVRPIAYRPGDDPKIMVTTDGKVMLRPLLEAGGLTNWKMKDLKEFVPIEEARTDHSAGRKPHFARVADLISGISVMQRTRRERKLKINPEWDNIRSWLVENFSSPGEGEPVEMGDVAKNGS